MLFNLCCFIKVKHHSLDTVISKFIKPLPFNTPFAEVGMVFQQVFEKIVFFSFLFFYY